MEQLIKVLERFGDMDVVIAELKACDCDIETVDDLVEYLEDELDASN